MVDTNSVVLVGRLCNEVQMSYTAKGTACMSFNIAVNRGTVEYGQWTETADFYGIKLWGKQAEAIQPFMTKGKQVTVAGSLVQEKWEKDGKKNSKTLIYADHIQLHGSKNDGAAQNKNEMKPKEDVPQEVSFAPESNQTFPEDIPF